MSDYITAKKRALSAVQELGPGWEPALNENLGWFAKVHNPEIGATIHINDFRGKLTYDCELLHEGHQQWGGAAKTPTRALKRAREALKLRAGFYKRWLERLGLDIPERG